MDRGAWQALVHGVATVGHETVTKPPPHHPLALTTMSPYITQPLENYCHQEEIEQLRL